jgi:hypothetical protein
LAGTRLMARNRSVTPRPPILLRFSLGLVCFSSTLPSPSVNLLVARLSVGPRGQGYLSESLPDACRHLPPPKVVYAIDRVIGNVLEGGSTELVYNSNQSGVNAPLSRNTMNQYDEFNRLKQITDPASGHTLYRLSALYAEIPDGVVVMSRKRALLAILALAVVAVVSFGAYLWRTGDTSSHYEYATYADIKNDRSVHAATVPSFVPRSAREIVGRYNAEFNTQTLEFAFDPTDEVSMTSAFQRVAGAEGDAIEQKLRSSRWKKDFPSSSDSEVFVRHSHDVVEYLAIDAKNARVYYAAEPSKG